MGWLSDDLCLNILFVLEEGFYVALLISMVLVVMTLDYIILFQIQST